MRKQIDVAIVGMGNWGTSLANGCLASGVPLREVVVRKPAAQFGNLPIVSLERAALDAHVIWICVRDDEIAALADQIALHRGDMTGQIVVHSSGALTAKELEAVKRVGARVGSVAPVMSFPSRIPVPLQGTMYAVEGQEEILETLEELLRKLGGEPFRIEAEKKSLYHAAATMASPLLLSEITAAAEMAKMAGLPEKLAEKWVGTLGQATIRNFLQRGSASSFSGPFFRGDLSTIRLHLQVLGEHPMLKEIYSALAQYAIETLPVRRRDGLRQLLRQGPRPAEDTLRPYA